MVGRGGAEFFPVAVATGFWAGAQVFHSSVAPELPGPLEAALPLPARRLHRARFAARRFPRPQFFAQFGGVAAAQSFAAREHPRARGRGAFAVQGRAQRVARFCASACRVESATGTLHSVASSAASAEVPLALTVKASRRRTAGVNA